MNDLIFTFLAASLILGGCAKKKQEDSPAAKTAKEIVAAPAEAKTHEEWHSTDAKVSELKSAFFSLNFTEQDRCQALGKMGPEDLIAFYDEIRSESGAGIAACQGQLLKLIDDYLAQKNAALTANYKQVASEVLKKCSDNIKPTFGPEETMVVDPTKGGTITGSHFDKCKITMTFDDGPHPFLGPLLLQTLKEQNLHANFFAVGQRVAESPETTVAEYEAGNVIGTHSWSHPNMQKLSVTSGVNEIEKTFTEVDNVLKITASFFRFPYGNATKDLRAYLNKTDRVEFLWNIDTLDWKTPDPEKLFRYALAQINGVGHGIVLMHEIHPQSILVLPFILDSLRTAGYTPMIIRPTPSAPAHVP